ncbi:hypothetical protein ISN75_14125 [Dyella marensis]|uniref:capsid assembly protein n=1 Tax=Dyella marensis TaxID=500610 RepID=UPI0031D1CFB9
MSEQSQITLSTDQPPADPGQQQATTTQQETTFGGYKTVEELVAAHEALKGTQQPPASSEGDTEGASAKPSKEIPDNGSSDEAAQAAVSNAGLDWDALNTEYADKGQLSEETYASLAKAGIPRTEVDTYIAGKQAQADAYDAAVFDAAGGADNYQALIEWAANNLSKAEKVAFNDAVTSGKPAVAALAVEGLASRFASKRGTPPGAMLKGGGTSTGVQPFKSQHEVTSAMRDARYKTDPAFRQEVLDRLRESEF